MAEAEKTIDLTRYRTAEIAGNISEILCIDRVFITWLRCLVIVLAIFQLIVFFVFRDRLEAPWLHITITYGVFAGLCCGGLIGLCRVLGKALAHLSELIRLMINVVRHAADDFRQSRAGGQRLPTAGELFKAVYRDVTLPIIENILSKQVWIVGKPMLWIYRRTLGRLVDFAISRAPAEQFESADATELHEAYVLLAETSAENEAAFEQCLQTIDQVVTSIEGRMRRWALRPLYALAAVLSLLVTLPLIAIYYFA